MTREIEQTYESPRWSGELADCSLPVTLDTYSNCAFGCTYCFSQYQRNLGNTGEAYRSKKVKCVNVEKIRRLFDGEDTESQFYPFIRDRHPIQYGGLSDQFDNFERKYGKTLEVLRILKRHEYPCSFSTKSTWVFDDDRYMEMFDGADYWSMKFSIITLDERDARKIEVGVDTPERRLEAMRKYSEVSNGGTVLRFRPFMPGVSDKNYLELIEAAHEHGADAVSTEFFCLEMRSVVKAREHYRHISETCGFDIVEFYRRYSNGSGYLRLNRSVKAPYIEKMRDLTHKLGMRFYVSDMGFKECSDNACCCGLRPDYKYTRGHFAAALQIAKRCGEVHFRDVEDQMYFMTMPVNKAKGLNLNTSENRARLEGMTMKDYMRYLWNTPRRGQSPYRVFDRVLRPDGIDENGDIVYRYDTSRTFEKMQGMEIDSFSTGEV